MQSRTIPPEQWSTFIERFNRDHLGWPVTVEVLDKQFGPQLVAKDLNLLGMTIEDAGSRSCVMEIAIGDRPDRHVDHLIDKPLFIRELENNNGIDLQVEPAEGPVTLMHFYRPLVSATVISA
jgi:hypothetical protein